MGRKEEYKLQNEQFLETLRTEKGIKELPCGILYRVLEKGKGEATPRYNSVVSVTDANSTTRGNGNTPKPSA